MCPPLVLNNGSIQLNSSDDGFSRDSDDGFSGDSDGSGSYPGDGATYGTVALHSCDAGFVLTGGNTTRVCGDGEGVSGVWSGRQPVCIRK